jgi:hypothetical protein
MNVGISELYVYEGFNEKARSIQNAKVQGPVVETVHCRGLKNSQFFDMYMS